MSSALKSVESITLPKCAFPKEILGIERDFLQRNFWWACSFWCLYLWKQRSLRFSKGKKKVLHQWSSLGSLRKRKVNKMNKKCQVFPFVGPGGIGVPPSLNLDLSAVSPSNAWGTDLPTLLPICRMSVRMNSPTPENRVTREAISLLIWSVAGGDQFLWGLCSL